MRRNILLTFAFMLVVALGAAPAVRAQTAPASDGSEEMFIGKPDAPITMIAYESILCPHCAAFHTGTTISPVRWRAKTFRH